MSRKEMLDKLASVRALVRAMQDGTDNPSIERAMAMVARASAATPGRSVTRCTR